MYEHNAPGLVRAEAKFANQWLAGDFAIGGASVCGRWLTGRASDFETAVEEVSVRTERQFYGTADSGSAQWQARLLSWPSLPVNTINPGNSQDAGLDSDFDLIADVKPFVIVGIDREAFDFLPRTPGLHDETAS